MKYALLGQGTLAERVRVAVDIPPVLTTAAKITANEVHGLDLGISVGYRHILKSQHLKAIRYGVINLHTGYLPWNRGAYPNVWPLIDGTPAGVTLHWMDEGIDTGPIIAQRPVDVHPWDTAGTLYERLQDAAFDLFVTMWPRIKKLDLMGWAQRGAGTTHTKAELETLDGNIPGFDAVLARLRARTFPGYGLEHNGMRITVNIENP